VTNARDNPIKTTGTWDWSEGVDSLKTPTVVGPDNPNGLTKQMLAWAVNLTMRDGSLSPRDPWIKKGAINLNLQPQIIPGKPQQTIPQPNIPPFPTPAAQISNPVPNPSRWYIAAVGSTFTINISPGYSGNNGDITQIQGTGGQAAANFGTFVVTSFTSGSITLQTVSSTDAGFAPGVNVNQPVQFNLSQLAPGTPQPPIVIPATPPTVIPVPQWFQGGIIFNPPSGTPYAIIVVGGHVLQVDVDFNSPPIDLSEQWGLFFPITPRCYFCQAETFLIIQAGDYDPATGNGTLPLFWDGSKLTQSNGLTGVTVVGVPAPNAFPLKLADSWTPNGTAGQLSPALVLTSPYPGNLYDNIALVNSANALIGNFRVSSITGNTLILETLYLQNGGTIAAAASLTATLTFPIRSNGSTDQTQNVTIGDGSWTVPSQVGQKVLLNLTSLYYGSTGDTIELYSANGTQDYGTFQVISFNASFQLVLEYIAASAANYSGKAIFGTMLSAVTAVRSFSQNFTPNGAEGLGGPFVVTSAGGSSTVYWPAFDGSPLSKLYDNVNISVTASGLNLGTYRIVSQGNKISNQGHSFPFITLESLVPNPTYVGQDFFVQLTMTVVPPPNAAGYLVVNAGTWSIPTVGSSVSLQMLWPDILGPSYPGNLGDIVQLLQGASTLAYFRVTSFDLNGDITLTTFSNSTYTTPATSIGQTFTGEQTLTMTIVQPPSVIGTNVSQIPAAGAMVYYQGIVWYAQGGVFSGGDIRGGPSGTNAPTYTNSVLNVTENPLALGGDGFSLPIPGNITGMAWPQQQNASLGQGVLYIGTVNGVCSFTVPSNRQNWITMNASNPPIINVVLGGKSDSPGYGFVNDWGIVSINGDLYFQTIKPGVTSIILAQRYFQQWGNIDISTNEQRIWDFTNTQVLGWISGFLFDNRMQMTALPQLTQYGTIHKAIMPMDMSPIDTFEELTPPNWEGMLEGLQIFQLLTSGQFNSQQRAFAITLNETNPGEFDLWENIATSTFYFDNTGTANVPIQWQFETPSFDWGKVSDPKELLGGELFYDQIVGEVIFRVDWRPDFASCWTFWDEWKVCFAADTLTVPNIKNPSPYPKKYPPGYKFHALPRPPQVVQPETGIPAARAYQHQIRITVTGQARIRGFILHAQFLEKNIYSP
jgi:hypothetical protein